MKKDNQVSYKEMMKNNRLDNWIDKEKRYAFDEKDNLVEVNQEEE